MSIKLYLKESNCNYKNFRVKIICVCVICFSFILQRVYTFVYLFFMMRENLFSNACLLSYDLAWGAFLGYDFLLFINHFRLYFCLMFFTNYAKLCYILSVMFILFKMILLDSACQSNLLYVWRSNVCNTRYF